MATRVTAENFKTGLLVSDEEFTGVVELPTGAFALFCTELVSSETTRYDEFPDLHAALFALELHTQEGGYHFEAFGCDKGSSCKGGQKGGCENCGNAT